MKEFKFSLLKIVLLLFAFEFKFIINNYINNFLTIILIHLRNGLKLAIYSIHEPRVGLKKNQEGLESREVWKWEKHIFSTKSFNNSLITYSTLKP